MAAPAQKKKVRPTAEKKVLLPRNLSLKVKKVMVSLDHRPTHKAELVIRPGVVIRLPKSLLPLKRGVKARVLLQHRLQRAELVIPRDVLAGPKKK